MQYSKTLQRYYRTSTRQFYSSLTPRGRTLNYVSINSKDSSQRSTSRSKTNTYTNLVNVNAIYTFVSPYYFHERDHYTYSQLCLRSPLLQENVNPIPTGFPRATSVNTAQALSWKCCNEINARPDIHHELPSIQLKYDSHCYCLEGRLTKFVRLQNYDSDSHQHLNYFATFVRCCSCEHEKR